MKKRYGSSKGRYSDFLTVLLVLVIIAILALIGFFGYKAINKKSIEVGSQNAFDTFQNSVKNLTVENEVVENEVIENEVTNEVEDDGDTDMSGLISDPVEKPKEENPTVQQPEVPKQYYEGYEVKGSISIPKTGINYVILEKVTPKSLAAAPAILDIVGCDSMSGTIKSLNVPGTNALILGHNYRNGLFFSNNYKLTNGDTIKITDTTGLTVTYTIYNMYYTDASDASFMERELDPNVREITLQTCNDDSSERLIIWAKDK